MGALFLVDLMAHLRFGRAQVASLLPQIYYIGVRSLVIIMVCAFFIGLVLAIGIFSNLEQFGADELVGSTLTLVLFRELGPVLTGLLFAGRAGTSVAAEVGLMKATEQLDALELMAIDPLERVIQPRWVAGIIALPLLSAIFCATGLLGGWVYVVALMGQEPGVFWGNIVSGTSFQDDFLLGVYKSIVFGLLASSVAVFCGYTATPTGQGAGTATTQTVIVSAILILIANYVFTAYTI